MIFRLCPRSLLLFATSPLQAASSPKVPEREISVRTDGLVKTDIRMHANRLE
jgi:hypothetical protein